MSTETKTKAEHRDLSHDEYHAHPAIGASQLECFRKSRRLFHAMYVAKTIQPPPPSPAMQLGTLVHLRLLEPERFAATVAEPFPALAPDGKRWLRREGSDHAKWWQEELDKRAGQIACDEQTLDRVEAIAASTFANYHARKLLERDGMPEFSIFWKDNHTGLDLKCRVDWMSSLPIDIKTTNDPSPAAFSKRIVEFGYHRSRAHYMAGIHNYRDEPIPMVHLAIGTEPPYQVVAYDIDDTDASNGQSLGNYQWRQTLAALVKCHESDDWRDPHEKTIVSVRLPGWAFGQDAYSFLGE